MPPKRNRPFRRILVTAGPTREMLDPVRFITNLSTGEMGYAIAREAKQRGFRVTLLSGPTALTPPQGVWFVPFLTVKDLDRALRRHFFRNDVLVMSAAVGDFIPLRQSARKIRRRRQWQVKFRQAPDLVRGLAMHKGRRVVIGFSLETGRWLARSREKLKKKHLDGIVANFYSARHNPFGQTPAHVAFIDRRTTRVLRFSTKRAMARKLLDWMIHLKNYSGAP